MWSIRNIDNTVVLTREQALVLATNHTYAEEIMYGYDGYAEDPDDDDLLEEFLEEKNGNYYLKFEPDHMEHMDYVLQIAHILQDMKVKGDITFASLEGKSVDNHWGYRFDGNGGMKTLSAVITFIED